MALNKNLIGTNVDLNGKTYKITGTQGKSYVLIKDGVEYRATPAKIDRIVQYAKYKSEFANHPYPNLARRLQRKQIFKKDATLPTNAAECMDWFESLNCELSPENLHCDGEATRTQIQHKLAEIRACWKELESISGRKVSEEEVENRLMVQYRN